MEGYKYESLPLVFRDEEGPEEIEIDETVFNELYEQWEDEHVSD